MTRSYGELRTVIPGFAKLMRAWLQAPCVATSSNPAMEHGCLANSGL